MLYFIIYFIYLFAFKTGQIMGYVTYRMCMSLFQRVCVTTERATGLISGLSNYTVKISVRLHQSGGSSAATTFCVNLHLLSY